MKKAVSFKVEAELFKRVKAKLALDNKTFTKLIEEAMKKYLGVEK